MDPITESEYAAIIAKASEAVAATQDLNIDLWNATIAPDHDALVASAQAAMQAKAEILADKTSYA